MVDWLGWRRSARTDGGSLLELPGLVLLSVVFLDQCEISVRLGDPTVQAGGQAGSLPTAARSLDRLCSFPWLIIAVSVERGLKRAWR